MLRFYQIFAVLILFYFISVSAITTENSDGSVNELRYCLQKSANPNFKECVGRTAISFLQRFDEQEHFTFADSLIASRGETLASRSLVNILDTDPVDFRGILENAGAVISQRALEFHMDALYPGLMFKIGPTADSSSVAEFMLDPTVDERNFNYEEPSTARILTKQYFLPFLLGLKFNLVVLVPILFTIICLLLKKALFIAKLVVYMSSILGVGGIAGALGKFSGLQSVFNGYGFSGLPPPPNPVYNGPPIGGGIGIYPGKNTVYPQYDQDELQHVSPYKRQDRQVIFDKTRENSGRINVSKKNKMRTKVEPPALNTPSVDRFYEYEKQFLTQDHSDKLRTLSSNLAANTYDGEDNEEVTGVLNVASNHHFKTSDNSGWKVLNLRDT